MTQVEIPSHRSGAAVREALEAAARGIPTVPCCWPEGDGCGAHPDCGHPGKRPLPSKYAATMDAALIRARYARLPLAGVKWVLPCGVLALDIDARHGGPETVSRWVAEFGPAPLTWADGRGDAGGHYLFASPLAFSGVLVLGPGVEAFGEGAELVMPPSLHPSGTRRAWRPGCSPRDRDLAEAPDWLIRKVRAARFAGHRPRRRGGPLTPAELEEFARLLGSVGPDARGRTRGLYRCPFHPDTSPSLSVDWTRGLFCCFAASCGERGGLARLRQLVNGVRP